MTYNGHIFSGRFFNNVFVEINISRQNDFPRVESIDVCIRVRPVYRSQRAKFRLRETNALFRVRGLAPGCLCGIGHGLVVNEVG